MDFEDLAKALAIAGAFAVLAGLLGFPIIHVIRSISGQPFEDVEIAPWFLLGAGLVSWLIAAILYSWPQSRYV